MLAGLLQESMTDRSPLAFIGVSVLMGLLQTTDALTLLSAFVDRAFVEFSRNPTERFKTLPAVYMAIKMSQLKVALELSVHPAEEIEGKVQVGPLSKLRNTRYLSPSLVSSLPFPSSLPSRGLLQGVSYETEREARAPLMYMWRWGSFRECLAGSADSPAAWPDRPDWQDSPPAFLFEMSLWRDA